MKKTNTSKLLISLVIPVHNEAESLEHFYKQLNAVLKKIDYDFEIIFVNDGSSDSSGEILDNLEASDERVCHIEFSRNFGKEQAVSAGYHQVLGEAALSLDADLQHPVDLIPDFITKWEEGAEVVVGVRNQTKSDSLIKRVGSHCFYKIINRISEVHIIPRSTD